MSIRAEVTYSDHFSILQPTFTTTETTPKSPSAMEEVLQPTQESITSGSELNPDPIAARGLLQTLRGTPDREPTPEDFSALVPQPTMEGVLKPTDEFTDEPMQDASMAL